MTGMTQVRILVDPVCPWTYRTARWLLGVRGLLNIEVAWGLLSLEYVNRGVPGHPMAQRFRANRLAMRALRIAGDRLGEKGIEELYLSLAQLVHEGGMSLGDLGTVRAALKARGLPWDWADEAQGDESLEARLWEQYERETSKGAFGVPTLFFGGQEVPYYGPVISKVPQGEEAIALWRGIVELVNLDFFYELKRPR